MNKSELRILIVDDDSDDRLLTESLLREGFKGVALELDQAHSYQERLMQVAKSRYDALLFDYCVRGKTGLDLIRDVRARGVDTPVVFLAGQGDEEVTVEVLKYGTEAHHD